MGVAARKRKAKKPGQEIRLQNPTSAHHEAFIAGNALYCDPDQALAVFRRTGRIVDSFSAQHHPVVVHDSAKGQTLVIAGAGPSLRDHAQDYCSKADQVWGCNTGLTYLHDNGFKVTHGFCIDQTAEMLAEWESAPDVEYLLASTVHVHLTEYLVSKQRRIRWFHNFVGIKTDKYVEWDGRKADYEDWLYLLLYPGTVRAGSGLNAVTRAIDVGLYMGFDKITVLGADCALKVNRPAPKGAEVGSSEHRKWLAEDVEMHADGGSGVASNSTPITMQGEIDGRIWTTKPDLMISAVFLSEIAAKLEGRVELIGDTLPNALKGKPREFLDRLPHLVDSKGRAVRLANYGEDAVSSK